LDGISAIVFTRLFLSLIVLTPVSVWFADAASPVATWPQWRGPGRDGISAGPAWPGSLAGLQQSWRVELDKGFPGPIVAEDRVFVAETANQETEIVRALDRKTGKELWRASWPGKHSVPFYAKRSGDWIRSTPAYDGKTLYVGGMEELLVALDAKTGKEKWRVDFPKRFQLPKPEFGFASSPLVDGKYLYVQAANALVKLDKETGSTVWRVLEQPGNVFENGAFSSPFIATLAGKRQLLVQTRTTLNGVDLETGQRLWNVEVPNFRGMNILTPLVFGDRIFTSTYRNDSYLFEVTKGTDGFSVKELWRNKAKGYMSTGVRIGDYLYLHLQSQRFTCIDLRSGETKWTSEPYGQYWSVVVRGDSMLALDERGQLHLIKANPESFQLLDSREVAKSSAWAHLAVAGDELFVRDLTGITAWRWGSAPAATN
jgi:outer membrane protein assembly factor BamB